ncbi:PQQ-dependent sugar dehydrogenase [Neisseria dentiae]|uniref:PQQ-dependent sugar dehydrogenase n=1 Tax=Neisseria dentiae TaxID=194197 RepID=UPI000A18C53B|nr:PQQ-dependent sugar dehydrogenase [Neisseria dentiae]QMT46203.1 PQQ-dependent sugar dehydrogenase [Neisseria dentiae]STZ52339.1 Soluble aldose sugar dehydrogenase yliI precursor [Neisseria dentiae]
MFAPKRLGLPLCLLLSATACAESASSQQSASNTAPAAISATQAVKANPQPSGKKWQWQTVAQGLNHPWALAFLPDGRFLVSERSGNLRIIGAQGQIGAPIAGLPNIDVGGQGGLLDVVLDEQFAQNRRLYFCFSEAGGSGNSTALAEAKLSADNRRLEQVKTLFSQRPKIDSSAHFGCRIVLTPQHIYLGLGDRYSQKDQAQKLDNHIGKIVRLNRNGGTPSDNPFAKQNAAAEIWSYGHRNIQGMTADARGRLWTSEHGAQGGDEINLIEGGKNYGWPVITYGTDYGGGKIGEGITAKAGMEQPLYYWNPSIAPSGLTFVGSNPYGSDWQGNLLAGSLKFGYVARLKLDNTRVSGEEKIEVGERVRDVRQAPDGFVYVLTDSGNGKLLKLLPQ